MTWRFSKQRAPRVRKVLPAVARPSEGPAATPGKSSLNCAPGGFPPKVTPGASFSGEQTREAIQELVNRGYSDGDLAQHFGGTKNALRLRRRYLGIDSAVDQGRQPGEMPPAYDFRRDRAAERDEIETAFHLEHGNFQSFTERQINNYEVVYAATRAKRRTVDVMPRLYGDPSPNRVRV